MEPESRLGKDIISLIEVNKAIDKQFRWDNTWNLGTITCVVNEQLQQRFFEKKQELKQILSREPPEAFAFGLTESECEADNICSSGSFSSQSLNVPLGSVDQGVNVCLFPDVLLQWAEKKSFRQPCIVIYKVQTCTVHAHLITRGIYKLYLHCAWAGDGTCR